MCYPVCGVMHIKEPLLLIGKSSPCGGSGFPFSLSEGLSDTFQSPSKRGDAFGDTILLKSVKWWAT